MPRFGLSSKIKLFLALKPLGKEATGSAENGSFRFTVVLCGDADHLLLQRAPWLDCGETASRLHMSFCVCKNFDFPCSLHLDRATSSHLDTASRSPNAVSCSPRSCVSEKCRAPTLPGTSLPNPKGCLGSLGRCNVSSKKRCSVLVPTHPTGISHTGCTNRCGFAVGSGLKI